MNSPQSTFSAGSRVAVLLPLPVETAYDYLVPDGLELVAGDIVEVPLARRFEVGVVWGAGTGDIPTAKLREVVHKLDLPPIPGVLRRFIDWVALNLVCCATCTRIGGRPLVGNGIGHDELAFRLQAHYGT